MVPKIAEFDFEGWHADPYIERISWCLGGFDSTNITIDKVYFGGTGYKIKQR
jgi:hypothetical protein